MRSVAWCAGKKQRVTEVVRDTLCGVARRCGAPAVVLRFVSVVLTLDMAPGVFFLTVGD